WSSSCWMRRLAAASAMWLARAAFVMLCISAMRTKSARDPRSGRLAMSGDEPARRDRAGEIARQRQGLALELAGEQLRTQRRPEQAARSEPGRRVDAVRRGRPEDRQAVGNRGTKARPSQETRGICALREPGK